MTIKATLCIIIRDNNILLQRKVAGRFGEGKWNGAGGKLGPRENPMNGIIREVREETGLKIREPKPHGVLKHFFGDRTTPAWSVHIFSAREFEGEPVESDEGELRWFPVEEIPYEKMWADDEHWLPLLLAGEKFEGEFYFDKDAKVLLDFDLNIK